MQGTEHQMPGLRRRQREAYGFEVAHLAHQDGVRVFAQGRAQRLVEAEGIAVNLALVDQALLAFVHEFDRVLDRQDVAVLGIVLVVDHPRQGRRFTRTGRTGDQHDTARIFGNFLEDLGRAEIFQAEDFRGNGSEHTARTTVVVECVYPKTREAGNFE